MISEQFRRHFAVFLALALALTSASRVRADESRLGDAPATARPWLGIIAQDITPDLRGSMNLPKKGGALIGQVLAGSPAATAGLEEGDAILALDGRTVDDAGTVREIVAAKRPGDALRVRYFHDGKERTVRITLGERPATIDNEDRSRRGALPPMAGERPERGARRYRATPRMLYEDSGPRLGIRVHPLNGDLASYFDVPDKGGVLVLEVLPDTPAGRAGLRGGDVIREVDGNRVASPEELVRAIAGAGTSEDGKAGEVKLSIRRKGHDMTVGVTPETPKYRDPDAVRPGRSGMMRLGPGGPAWLPDAGPGSGSGDDQREIDQLRDEVRKLRQEIEGMKNQR